MSGFDLAALVRDYGDPLAEARACRRTCALFDFSFVHRLRLRGPRAARDLGRFCQRDLATVAPGTLRYALHRAPDGAVLSDVTVWRLDTDTWEMMSGRGEDLAALARDCDRATECRQAEGGSAIFAVQGPASPDALRALIPPRERARLAALAYFAHAGLELDGVACRLGRLGYTGERGFEIIAPAAQGPRLWHALAARAAPAGFAAADCLRIEAGFILFANDCRLGATATELGLERFAAPGDAPARFVLTAFTAGDGDCDPPWRPARDLRPPGPGEITVTSACPSPHLGGIVGLGFVAPATARPGTRVHDPRGAFDDIRLLARPPLAATRTRVRASWAPA